MDIRKLLLRILDEDRDCSIDGCQFVTQRFPVSLLLRILNFPHRLVLALCMSVATEAVIVSRLLAPTHTLCALLALIMLPLLLNLQIVITLRWLITHKSLLKYLTLSSLRHRL